MAASSALPARLEITACNKVASATTHTGSSGVIRSIAAPSTSAASQSSPVTLGTKSVRSSRARRSSTPREKVMSSVVNWERRWISRRSSVTTRSRRAAGDRAPVDGAAPPAPSAGAPRTTRSRPMERPLSAFFTSCAMALAVSPSKRKRSSRTASSSLSRKTSSDRRSSSSSSSAGTRASASPVMSRLRRRACAVRKRSSSRPIDMSTSSYRETGEAAITRGTRSSVARAVKGSAWPRSESPRHNGPSARLGGVGGYTTAPSRVASTVSDSLDGRCSPEIGEPRARSTAPSSAPMKSCPRSSGETT